ncbi:FG-GAP-like repeat-containing protein [Nocardioides antri]|uniref:DUF2510 domain-containing protein n=1 Tax=Nocardioides antri TaxID=2607659 RepID=A0A5B1LZ01_9ACTN|nr:FG-GAP-like repeat-containing protein [Nocardioides antri]KAA1425893.1 hypothetical protein F0U47_16245 [Nocardioides antri]
MTIGDGGSGAPPGWYPDGPGWERRWDGAAWTADRRPVPPPSPQRPGPPPGPPGDSAAPPTAFRPVAPNAGPGPVAPSGPPPGAPFGAPGPSPYSTPPPARKKSLLWLWIALAVVLVVVIASVATLLVVQPWSDDDGGEKEAGGGEETTEPTDGPTDAAVRGDLDGDGRGDVLGRYYDDTENRLTLTNADGTFELAQEPTQQEENLIVGDFDGDGASDIGSWFDASGTLQFEVEDTELSLTQEFDLWFKVAAIKAAFGDFDGDGLVDIAAYGQQHRSQVAVWVLHNNGEGFDEPEKWAALPNATYGSTELIVGDFNGDASDDVMAVVPNEPVVRGDFDSYYWYGDFGVTPLIAGPGSFARGGIAAIETDLYDQEYAVGDFDGDGKETLVADNYFEDSFVFYEYDGTTLRPTGSELSYAVAGDGVMDGVVAVDLDGNQLDDLVFTSVDIDDYTFLGAWAALADPEGGLDTPTEWAQIPPCSGDYCEVDYFEAQ